MPTAFLLGAGCPCAIRVDDGLGKKRALVPDVLALTAVVSTRLSAAEKTKAGFAIVLKQLKGKLGREPNIEEILTQIRTLRQVIGNEKLDGLTAEDLDALDIAACQEIVNIVEVKLPNGEQPFAELAGWISAVPREHPVEIFTTNYDLLIEQSLEACRVPYFDGFVGANHAFFDLNSIEQDKVPSRWARVWKLHGSVSWFQGEAGHVFRGYSGGSGARRLIHPSHLKYEESRRMPYLAMMDRLRAFLKQEPAALFVCGYSFSDYHLNEILVQSLEGNPSAACFALLFNQLEAYPNAAKLAKQRPNLNVLAPDEGTIGARRGKWMKPGTLDATTLGAAFEIKEPVHLKKESAEAKPAAAADLDAPQEAKCRLGDFAYLGKFLSEIAGAQMTTSQSNGS
ncbi:MAG: SIR2 family protein [Alphaproteobacteria bacterium]